MGGGFHVEALPEITAVGASVWDRMWPYTVGSTGYARACLDGEESEFSVSALGVRENGPAGQWLAALPLFAFRYRLDMPLGASVRRVSDWLEHRTGASARLPVLVAGSPFADRCAVGLAPDLGARQRDDVLAGLADGLLAQGRGTGAHLIAIKDLDPETARVWEPALTRAGFVGAASMPVAVLDLPYRDLEGYFAELPSRVRADVRRKERQSRDVTFETVSDPASVEPLIVGLYDSLRRGKNAAFDDFSALPGQFVTRLAETLPKRAHLMVGRVDGVIKCFNLFFTGPEGAVAAKIGFRQDEARRYNLYFATWLAMVRWCLEHGITRLELGQTSYPLKVRLGCRLEKRWVYFRHRNDLINRITRYAGPLAAFDTLEAGGRGA